VALAYYGTFFAFQSIIPSMICALICGVGVMSIGVNIMHDGNHGAVSDKAWVSHLYGLGLDFIGASSFIWKYQHNVGHHQHPNIAEHDPDIGFGSKILRLNPYQEWKPHHRFQHIYLPMLYGFHIMKWHINDFLTLKRGRVFNTRLGPLSTKDYITFFVGKSIFFGIFMVFPMYHNLNNFWLYFLAEQAAGYWGSLMFAVGHLTEDTAWPITQGTNELDEDFAIAQVITSTGFAHDSPFWTFMSGGLNYQTEHHLFPSVCHVHYPNIAPIVKQACAEYGIPYHCYPTFWSAVRAHLLHIYRMGQEPLKKVQ